MMKPILAEATGGSDDGTYDKATNMNHWQKLCNDAALQFKKDISCADKLKERMPTVVFVGVHETVVKVNVSLCTMKRAARSVILNLCA